MAQSFGQSFANSFSETLRGVSPLLATALIQRDSNRITQIATLQKEIDEATLGARKALSDPATINQAGEHTKRAKQKQQQLDALTGGNQTQGNALTSILGGIKNTITSPFQRTETTNTTPTINTNTTTTPVQPKLPDNIVGPIPPQLQTQLQNQVPSKTTANGDQISDQEVAQELGIDLNNAGPLEMDLINTRKRALSEKQTKIQGRLKMVETLPTYLRRAATEFATNSDLDDNQFATAFQRFNTEKLSPDDERSLSELMQFEKAFADLVKLYPENPNVVGANKYTTYIPSKQGGVNVATGDIEKGAAYQNLWNRGKFRNPALWVDKILSGVENPNPDELAYKDAYDQAVVTLANVLAKGDKGLTNQTQEQARKILADPNLAPEFYSDQLFGDITDIERLFDGVLSSIQGGRNINLKDAPEFAGIGESIKELKKLQKPNLQNVNPQKSNNTNNSALGGAIAGGGAGFVAGSNLAKFIPSPVGKVGAIGIGTLAGAFGGESLIKFAEQKVQELIKQGIPKQQATQQVMSEMQPEIASMEGLKNKVKEKPLVYNRVGKDGKMETVISLSHLDNQSIKNSEGGFKDTAYPDGKGYSIGYGSMTGLDGKPVQAGDMISLSEGEQLYQRDAGSALKLIENTIKIPLSDKAKTQLVSFIYNAGPGAFKRNIVEPLNRGDLNTVIQNMMKFIHIDTPQGKKPSQGLINRRKKEINDLILGFNEVVKGG